MPTIGAKSVESKVTDLRARRPGGIRQADGPADAQVSSPREGGTQPSRTPPLSVSRENKQQEKGFLERENRRGPVEGLDQIAAQSWTRRNCGIGIWSGSVPPGSC